MPNDIAMQIDFLEFDPITTHKEWRRNVMPNNPNTSSKLVFAQIDAREYPVITWDYNRSGRTPEEERLLLDAQLEYLEGIVRLQAEIREKYEPKIAALDVDAEAGRGAAGHNRPIVDTKGVWAAQDAHCKENSARLDAVDRLYYT